MGSRLLATLAVAISLCAAAPAMAGDHCNCADCLTARSCGCAGACTDCGGCGQCDACCDQLNVGCRCGGMGCQNCCGQRGYCDGCYDPGCGCGGCGVLGGALAMFDGYGYCGPKLQVRTSALYMRRGELDDTPFIVQGNNVLVSAANFDFNNQPGIDAAAIWNFNDCWSAEGRYLWLDDHSAHAEGAFPGTAATANVTPITFGAPVFAIGDYQTELQSAELNLRRRIGHSFWFSVGSRWLEFNERFNSEFNFIGAGGNMAGTGFSTTNNLYGLQLGVDGVFYRTMSGLTFDGFVKAGIYANRAKSSAYAYPVGGPISTANDNADEFALVGETGLFASYPINCVWSIRGGYQVMWLSGIAVAGDQITQTTFFSGPSGTSTDSEGDAFYHGFNAGLQASW